MASCVAHDQAASKIIYKYKGVLMDGGGIQEVDQAICNSNNNYNN